MELFSDLLGRRFQVFTAGKDCGIDLLQGACTAGEIVAQCKHYWRSGYAKLKSVIAKKELPKIAKLNPKRYILATSVGLTPSNKEELRCILAPYCEGIDDIYGLDDLNHLLRKHPAVETAHYKLWLTSTSVLQRVLRNGSAVWNAIEEDEIKRKMSLYVQTGAYAAALKILGKHNYCIVSGIPGIGKTTLAQILVTRLLEDGFELLAVREDIREAFELLDSHRRQVVYYDDFLGQSSLGERLGKNEDQGILRLLSRAKQSKNLKVLFTTREYILADARRLYERLNEPELDTAKCVVKVEQYTRGRRARILYNHIYFCDLPPAHVRALLRDRSYRKIIDHANYSPRIIEWMTSDTTVTDLPARAFPQRFVEALDNPTRIWEHAFENQLTDDARAVLVCISTVSARIGHDDLREAWEALLTAGKSSAATMVERQRFATALKQLDGSFVRTARSHAEIVVDFHNPSIRNFVSRRVAADSKLIADLMNAAPYFEQVSHLLRLSADGTVEFKPTGMLSDGSPVRSAIVRTLGNRSPLFHVVRSRGGDERLERNSANIGERLSEAAKWRETFSGGTFLEFVCETATQFVATGDLGRVATVEACGFVASIVDAWPPTGGAWSELVTSILDGIRDELTQTSSSQDWVKWSEFMKMHGHLFDAKANHVWKELAELFCESEIETIRENADTAEEADSWLDDVRRIAQHWGIDIDYQAESLQEWMAERARHDEGGDEWDGERYWSQGSCGEGATDTEIDHLFDSLDRSDDE